MSKHAFDCTICHKNIGHGHPMTTTETGYAHNHCFTRTQEPKTIQTLEELASGRPDAVLSVEVIVEFVPEALAAEMVKAYNRRLLLKWQKDCQE